MRIRQLGIQNFRSLSGTYVLDIAPGLNVVVGANNVGKSSVLAAALLALSPPTNQMSANARRDRSAHVWIGVRGKTNDIAKALTAKIPLTVRANNDLIRRLAWDSEPTLEIKLGASFQKNTETGFFFELRGPTIFDLRNQTERNLVDDAVLATGVTLEADWNLANRDAFEAIRISAARLIGGWSFAGLDLAQFGPRNLVSANEDAVKQTLTYLRMKHNDLGYAPLATEFGAAFPEMRLDFADLGDYEFRPIFRPSGSSSLELTRESIGSGAWAYLAVLTSIRAAYVQGTRLMVLDEPHLYLHAALERRLIHHICSSSPDVWHDGAPDVLVATHSATFIEAAIARRGNVFLMRWKDSLKTSAGVESISGDLRVLGQHATDLLTVRRLVFVEGTSDAAALDELVPYNDSLNRYVPLRIPDSARDRSFLNALRVIAAARAELPDVHPTPVLVFDKDKEHDLMREWAKWSDGHPERTFKVIFVGDPESDFESVFCEEGLLVALVEKVTDRTLTDQEKNSIAAKIAECRSANAKGSRIVREVLGLVVSDESKIVTLPTLASIYTQNTGLWPEVTRKLSELMHSLQT